jgi:hypothetical protein
MTSIVLFLLFANSWRNGHRREADGSALLRSLSCLTAVRGFDRGPRGFSGRIAIRDRDRPNFGYRSAPGADRSEQGQAVARLPGGVAYFTT